MKTSDMARMILDLQRRLEILEEHVLGTLPEIVEPPTKDDPSPPKSSSKKKEEVIEDFELDLGKLPMMSTTEIVQACILHGHVNASRAMLREDLIDLLMGEPIDVEDPVEDIRNKTYSFVQENELMLRSQMQCDLHCPSCPNNTVVQCWTANHDLVDPQEKKWPD
tara:strand:+ start:1785 stop:2279 length:495 start_codon:yes stop_codon:yes gene_type:complete